MELTIKNNASRILLEKTDNGVILFELGEDGTVISKLSYELYYYDGLLNFGSIATFIYDMMEDLKMPIEEKETNTRLSIAVDRIDPAKPMQDEEIEPEADDDK